VHWIKYLKLKNANRHCQFGGKEGQVHTRTWALKAVGEGPFSLLLRGLKLERSN